MKNINTVFEAHCTRAIDKHFLLDVLTYVDKFVKKDPNHINFFGGNLLGVYPVKFTTSDDGLRWQEDILQVDDWEQLTRDVQDLPEVVKDRKVSGNPLNLSFLWVAHKGYTSSLLTLEQRIQLATATLDMLQYKFITSLHSRRFPHPANEQIALALYESLDLKTQLKRCGSWKAMVDERTEELLSKGSIHYATIREFNNDHRIVRMINDISSKLSSMFNIMTTKFHEIKLQDARIATSSKYMQVDGEAVLKEHINKYIHIKTVMHTVVEDRLAFIKPELITVLTEYVNTVNKKYLLDSLNFISENYHAKYKISLPSLVEDILMFSFDTLRKENVSIKRITEVVIHMLPILRSSRLLSPEYKEIKEKLDIVIDDAIPRISESDIASTKIGIVMYIVVRAFLEVK